MKKTETPQERLEKTSRERQYQLQKVPKMFNQLLAFMEYSIRKQFRTFTLLSICGSQKSKFLVDKHFQSSFNSLLTTEKLFYFQKAVQFGIISLKQGNSSSSIQKDENKPKQKQEFNLILHQGFRSIRQIKVLVDGFKISSKNEFTIDAQNYILRKSNKSDVKCFVLLAIRQSIPMAIRFSFPSQRQFEQNFVKIQNIIYKAYQYSIKRMSYKDEESLNRQLKNNSSYPQKNMLSSYGRPRQTNKDIKQQVPLSISKQQFASVLQLSKSLQQKKHEQKHKLDSSIVQDLINPHAQTQHKQEKTNNNNIIDQLQVEDEPFEINQQKKQFNFVEGNQLNNKNYSGSVSYFHTGYKNVFSLILPDFNLNQMRSLRIFTQVYHNDKANLTIYNHNHKKQRFKLKLSLKKSKNDVSKFLIDADLTKKWNSEVDESQIKQLITSQNSLICYQKHRRISKLFKQRDYLFLRHAFSVKNSTFIVDRSIQHQCFIPFESIQRAQIKHSVYQIYEQNQYIKIVADVLINHGGLMSFKQKSELTLNYLIGFSELDRFIQKQKQNYSKNLANLDWCIDSTLETHAKSQQSIKTQDFNEGSQISNLGINVQDIEIDQDQFYSIDQNTQTEDLIDKYQIELRQQKNFEKKSSNDLSFLQHRQQIQVDQNGLTILPQSYIKKRHTNKPIQNRQFPRIVFKYPSGSVLMKDDFIEDKTDGIKLVNQAKIAAQDNVLKFVMKTMKKNLFSGKSILSISLPVQIFREDSNLQRFCQSMTLGPHFLQKAAATTDIVQRMKYAICFGLSNSILYFYLQKPFNPILGQTYQGIINGCPIYAQQTSHHPPISSLYFIGRGYKISGSLQSKVYLHLNSGDGVNQGYYNIHFDDGQVIKFQTAPGQLSGFTIGDRKFKYKDRMYVLDQKNCLYSQLWFQDFNQGFFSKSTWKYTDQMQGKIYKVSQKFMQKFMSSSDKINPKEKDIQQTLCTYEGRWLYYLNFEGVPYYNINQDLPYQLIEYEYPLNSNSSYREDLLYRIRNDLARSQIEKERLQILQRNDRKLRQKYHKSH